MARAKRVLDHDFREGAVRIVKQSGRPVAQIARELGINEGTLGSWMAADRVAGVPVDGRLSEWERAELVRLRRENADLVMECDVLKRSTAPWVRKAMGR